MSQTNIWPLVECLWEKAISLAFSTLTPFTSDNLQIRNFFEVSGLSFHSLLFKTSQGQWNSCIRVLGAPVQPSLDQSFPLFTSTLFYSLFKAGLFWSESLGVPRVSGWSRNLDFLALPSCSLCPHGTIDHVCQQSSAQSSLWSTFAVKGEGMLVPVKAPSSTWNWSKNV